MMMKQGLIEDGQQKSWRNQDKANEEDEKFGAKDEDWDVYKDLSKNGYEREKDELMQSLSDVNEKIADLDSNFNCLYFPIDEIHTPCAQDFQMKLGVDQFWGTEILFQPSIIGKDFAGITEILESIFSSLNEL